jgi:hypothetical protein
MTPADLRPAARVCRLGVTCIAASALLIAYGCGGSSPTAPSSGSGSGATLTATFSSIQTVILTPRCSGHHNGSQSPDLRPASAYASLVNARSTEQPNLFLVAPGDPEASYLIHKLEGRAGISGSRMPQGGPFLSSADIAVIRSWIQAGAANN